MTRKLSSAFSCLNTPARRRLAVVAAVPAAVSLFSASWWLATRSERAALEAVEQQMAAMHLERMNEQQVRHAPTQAFTNRLTGEQGAFRVSAREQDSCYSLEIAGGGMRDSVQVTDKAGASHQVWVVQTLCLRTGPQPR